MKRDQLCNHVLKRFIQLILVLVDHICTRTTSAFAQLGNYSPLYEIVYRPLRLRSQQVMINVGMTCYVHTSDISKSKTSPSFHISLSLIRMHQRAKVYDPTLSHSKVGPFLIAMFTSFLVILATLLPLLFKFGLTSPISQGGTNYFLPRTPILCHVLATAPTSTIPASSMRTAPTGAFLRVAT